MKKPIKKAAPWRLPSTPLDREKVDGALHTIKNVLHLTDTIENDDRYSEKTKLEMLAGRKGVLAGTVAAAGTIVTNVLSARFPELKLSAEVLGEEQPFPVVVYVGELRFEEMLDGFPSEGLLAQLMLIS